MMSQPCEVIVSNLDVHDCLGELLTSIAWVQLSLNSIYPHLKNFVHQFRVQRKPINYNVVTIAWKSFSLAPQNFMSYSSSVIWISSKNLPRNFTCHQASEGWNSQAWQKNPLSWGYQIWLSLHSDHETRRSNFKPWHSNCYSQLVWIVSIMNDKWPSWAVSYGDPGAFSWQHQQIHVKPWGGTSNLWQISPPLRQTHNTSALTKEETSKFYVLLIIHKEDNEVVTTCILM